jgi:hypothetical protein
MGIEELFISVFFAIFDFAKLAFFFSIFGIILYKIFTPVLEKIMDKYELTWIKAIFLLNLIVTFVVLELIYLYFYFYGLINAGTFDVELQVNLIDISLAIFGDMVRVIIASIIIAMIFLLSEFFSSMFISYQNDKNYSELIKQFIGIFCGLSVILFIGLFFFSWVPLGLFIYIFYGSVNALPVFSLIPSNILMLTGAII